MTTPHPAALPEPVGFRHSLTHTLHETEAEVQLADAESEAEPLYTADQMRARDAMWAERLAALQPQPAARDIAAELSLMVLCAVKDLPGLHANMLKDIDSAIEANRAALQPAAAVSDEELLTAYNSIDPCNESPTDRLIRRLRAILALRPQAVPMTVEQVARSLASATLLTQIARVDRYEVMQLVRAVEAHHGITQRADGGEAE